MRSRSRIPAKDPLPESFANLPELWQFWDTHSSADYEEEMEPVDLEIGPFASKAYCAIDLELFKQVRAEAHRKGLSTETLVSQWLQEKVTAA